MTQAIFDTLIEENDGVINDPFRRPLQMLAEQEYGSHLSIHDDDQAQELGISGAPIEGPTHFSQFDPLLHRIWGGRWYECGFVVRTSKTLRLKAMRCRPLYKSLHTRFGWEFPRRAGLR